MSLDEINSLTSAVLLAAFALSALFGAVARQSRFCTMGAISDVVYLGDWGRAKQWAAAAGAATIGFSALAFTGLIDPSKTLYATRHLLWLSALVGGALFGMGMVLSSGCGSKTLIRLGGGSLKALVVLLVMGLAAFATLKGITAVLRVSTVERFFVELPVLASLPELMSLALDMDTRWLRLLLGVVVGGALLVVACRVPRSEWPVWASGLVLGLLVVAAWYISGHWGMVEEHPLTLEQTFLGTNSGRAEALSFVSPVAYTLDWLMFFSDRSKVLTIGIVSAVGMVAGSAVQALWHRDFRWEGFASPQDLAHHLVGAVLMGVGGVVAMGCTIGQGLSALSALSLGSFLALAGIVAGAVVALRYQSWQLERQA